MMNKLKNSAMRNGFIVLVMKKPRVDTLKSTLDLMGSSLLRNHVLVNWTMLKEVSC